jgi:glycosyltransferase involved in cell wall biosynthesis
LFKARLGASKLRFDAVSPAHLHVQLDFELPQKLTVGRGTAVFVCGWCFAREHRIRSLALLVDGEPQPVLASGMPRLDPFQALHPDLDAYATAGVEDDPASPEDPLLHSYDSGFWALARIPAPGPERACRLELRAELADGSEAIVELGRIPIESAPDPVAVAWRPDDVGPRVAICLASYNPPSDLFARQLDSIRAQTHRNWVCVISDDCSSAERYQEILERTAGDERFIVSRSPKRLGFYGNFERALALAPADCRFVAMADQDDAWYPEKLATLIGALGSAQLVYSDARVVGRSGEVISETWWSRRRNNHSSLLSVLVANSVTGAASLMRREVLDDALPFPPAQFAHYHDHWIGLVALALGEIAYVERPLYDYVQHGEASLGHAAANEMPSLRERLLSQRPPRERVRMWRLHYYVDVCRLLQFSAILALRCGPRMSRRRRRELRRFTAAEHSRVALAALGVRGLRALVGPPETLGAEWMLFCALLWRRLLAASARERPQPRLRLDALPPPTLIQQARRSHPDERASAVLHKIAPLRFAVAEDAPRRINLLIPTIDAKHFFGGYIAKFNLARRLTQHGARVRIVTVDPVGPLAGDWRGMVESYSGLAGLFDDVEVSFGRESAAIEVSPADSFIATTWWTAHIARRAAEAIGVGRFLYLIQEYEPFTFPMGSYAALAEESYRFPHFALFSSELLRDYFRRHRIGVYAAGVAEGDRDSAAFQNAITPVRPPGRAELAARRSRRLLFYARPEAHAARNMFELGVLALTQALDDGAFKDGWELRGIGTVERGRRIALGGEHRLELIPRADQRGYGELLAEHDVGLALMYTPHPSLVPIEMASAGLLTVTNTFENKTPQALHAISANLVVVEPSIEAIAAGLREAARSVSDVERRLSGSAVNWSNDWRRSFDDELISHLRAALEGGSAPAL